MDDDTTLDIEEVADAGEYFEEEEEYEDIIEEEEDYESKVIDHIETKQGIFKEKTTIPYLTKYEKTILIGSRAQQLNKGAIPTVDVGNLKKTVDIAEKELKERKIPLIVRRYLPNGEFEDWRINELIF